MPIHAQYRHTNLVARDWRKLAQFYIDLFGCVQVGAERRAKGPWVEKLTGIDDLGVEGAHLRLPGGGDEGPTLEIFQFNQIDERPAAKLNQPGFAHIAFEVDDVTAARDEALRLGASEVGELVTTEIAGAGKITVVYLADPEGNIFELQHWHRE